MVLFSPMARQIGCGKTHTMMGIPDNEEEKGIIPRTFSQIITVTNSEKQKNFLVRCSFMEIYNQQIHDLLGKDIKSKMELKESVEKGVFVKDLTLNIVKTIEQMSKFMDVGFKNRAVRETAMNKQSSRSHSLFTIYIESEETDEKGNQKFKAGKLNLVDLAGSERQSKTHATGDGMKQAAKINLSLSALGNVISALVDGKTTHIPYRDSKLTRLLQDSLGGNTKTIMIAALSPADYNYQETLSTLRYAARAKFIQNKPKINEDPKDTLLREYADQIKRLKMMLEGKLPVQLKPSIVTEKIYIEKQNKENTNNSELQNQLKKKQELLLAEKQERAKLAAQLQSLQSVIKKQVPDQSTTQEMEKIKKLQEKLKNQKKKQEEYKMQKKRREQQLLSIQKNYKGLNDEVDQMRDRFKEIKKKYVASLTELRDVQVQHQKEKEQILDTVRYQQKQIKRYQAILNILMTNDQIEYISNLSEWNEEKRQYIVPPFYYRERTISFPKLNQNQVKQFIENEKQKKEIIFSQSPFKKAHDSNDSDEDQPINNNLKKKTAFPADKGYRLNHIVKNAKQGFQIEANGTNTYRSSSYSRQMQLTPIKNDYSERFREKELSNMLINDKAKKLEPINGGTRDVIRQIQEIRKQKKRITNNGFS